MKAEFKKIEGLPDHIIKLLQEREVVPDCTKFFITDVVKLRQQLFKDHEDTWDEKKEDYTKEKPKEIDELAVIIEEFIKENLYYLDVDFVLESLTKLGQAPNLLYDDNGHFACTGCGFQSVPEDLDEPGDIKSSFFVEKKEWKNTIREAIAHYLED